MSIWRNSDDSVLLGVQAETQRGTGILLLHLKMLEEATDNETEGTGKWASQVVKHPRSVANMYIVLKGLGLLQ